MNDDLDRKRTPDQNRKMWPMLTDFARQIDWPHTKRGQWRIAKMPPMSWKAVLTAAFEQEMEMAQGLEGGQVMVGASTSNYGVRKFADFINFLYATGNERGVVWSDKSEQVAREYAPKDKAA